MSPLSLFRLTAWPLAGAALVLTGLTARATDYGDITAVTSRVSPDYVRARLADGKFAPETFAFGPGGHFSGIMHDDTIDELKFRSVAHTLAGPLAERNYLPATDPNTTKLLLMVYWGTTTGWSDDPNALDAQSINEKTQFSHLRDLADARNAALLGYDAAGVIGTDYGRHLLTTALHYKTEDLTEEVEDNRYFVVLMAYDFQLLRTTKQHKLLWETRFSVRERHNDFGKILPDMAQYASRYFGQDSNGLVRRRLPLTSVNLGEMEVIGEVPDKK